jgi:YD repeat-containing protein
LSVSILPFSSWASIATYTYDNLNRLKVVDYNNGEQTITYTYDAAGNILTKTITATATGDSLPPSLTIDSPANGTNVSIPSLLMSGTATDAGQGDSGIASVMVNGIRADNDTATATATANWSLEVGGNLSIGLNAMDVTASDNSPAANQASDSITVVYLPSIADSDADGMPDGWEGDNSVSNPGADDDLDGISNLDEFKAGTDPRDENSKPEGADGISYVLFRDHFDDAQYQYRWYLTALDMTADHTLYESGTEIQTTLQSTEQGCAALRLDSFSSVDADNMVYHASLLLNGYGQTALGLMRDVDQNNRIEVLFNNDNEPYLLVRSVDNGTVVDIPAALPGSYQGAVADIRIAKAGAQYSVTVDGFNTGEFTNNGLGNSAIRPYIAAEQCDTDMGYVDSLTDVIELLRDTDADGVPDLEDNCINAANTDQRDTDGDNYGNACDGDLDNNGVANLSDFSLFRAVFGRTAPLSAAEENADFNGDGLINLSDFSLFRAQFGQAPGPSCCGDPLP